MGKLQRWFLYGCQERSLNADGNLVEFKEVQDQIQAYIASLEADRAALQSEIACQGTTLPPLHVKTKIAGLTLAIDKAKVMLG